MPRRTTPRPWRSAVPVIDVYGAFHGREELFDDESHFGVEGHRLASMLIHEQLLRLLAQ